MKHEILKKQNNNNNNETQTEGTRYIVSIPQIAINIPILVHIWLSYDFPMNFGLALRNSGFWISLGACACDVSVIMLGLELLSRWLMPWCLNYPTNALN